MFNEKLTLRLFARILARTATAYPASQTYPTKAFSSMSWMDSWSRPSANSTIPAPLYMSNENVPYCHTCGRVMSTKKSAKKNTEIKYCSDRCRSRKPGPLDRKIEKTIASLLNGEENSGLEKTAARTMAVKGDPRFIVTCDEIEEIVFGSRFDPEKVFGRRRNRKTRAIGEKEGEWRSVDMVSDGEGKGDGGGREGSEDEESGSEDLVHSDREDEGTLTDGSVPSIDGGVRIRPPQEQSEVNFSVGGERGKHEKIEESADDLVKRRQGAKRAEEKEMVRRAARRGVVFGFEVPKREQPVTGKKQGKSKAKSKRVAAEEDEEDATVKEATTEIRKAEAIMGGMVVEPSFAKGAWSIRWRE